MIPLVSEHLDAIRELCRKHRVKRLFLFGSVATGDFDPARSDLNFLVVFEPGEERGWDGVFFGLHDDLASLFGRPVDLVEAHTLKNPYLIASVNRTKQLLHAA
jgi:predicted nucleotidyltransferase